MCSLRVIVVLVLTVASTFANKVVFEDSTGTENSNNVGTRNGPFDDSVVIEAAGTPSNGDVDSRFFGLLGGGVGGQYPYGGIGGGYPIGGGLVGATKPGRCPGILGLGIGQPEGGYPAYGGGYGGYGGYPQYGGYGGYGGYPAGGYGGVYPGQFGYGGLGGYGFRSGDQGGEAGAVSSQNRRKRSEEAKKESDGDVQGRSHGDTNTDARFFGGIFGQQCVYDSHCPGQLKCCAQVLGKRATCQQPALIG